MEYHISLMKYKYGWSATKGVQGGRDGKNIFY